MNIKSQLLTCFSILVFLSSCKGQSTEGSVKEDLAAKGDTATHLGKSIMGVYQDRNDVYWFSSWDSGVYKYDGKELVHFTTDKGLLNKRIDEIKEDELGNIYFASANTSSAISKYDGKNFETLKAVPSKHWKLEPTDIWLKYSYGNTGKVYRYDGTTLYELKLPNPPNLNYPFEVYSIYKDSKGNIWFGTNPVGVCRYDGTSFEWITEEDVTEFRDEGANGVRSILEDRNGYFWFNTEYRYGIYDSLTVASGRFYTRHISIGGLDGKLDSHLDEYLSSVKDDQGKLWFVTYLDGVWMYDGNRIKHYPILEDSKQIPLFSIYKDHKGQLWLGTHQNGAYKFNGEAFEKFEI